MLVKKCLKGEVCEIFDNFFEIRTHEKSTRNNGFLLQVPQVRSQLITTVYNSLPIEHCQAECTGDLRDLLTKYF